MKLRSIEISNFRCCEHAAVTLEDNTCFVGPNGAGKSTVLAALNVFFRRATLSTPTPGNLTEEDFFDRTISKPVELVATFDSLSSEAMIDFKAYVRGQELKIKSQAVWNPDTRTAPVVQLGIRRGIKDFAPWFAADKEGAKADDLKSRYNGLSSMFTALPSPKTKVEMTAALREYEEAHPELCVDIESTDQFYGWSKGANLLRKYLQWVYIPAVRDASLDGSETKASALGELLERTARRSVSFADAVRQIKESALKSLEAQVAPQQAALSGLSTSLTTRLQEWGHPGAQLAVTWEIDPEKSVEVKEPIARARAGEGSFLGEIHRLGHGLQRSFIVAVLHEESLGEGEAQGTLVLGFEEPELYQHPPQAKYLARVLERLSASGNQVLVTTHSPYFAPGRRLQNLRFVRKAGARATIQALDLHAVLLEMSAALDENPEPLEAMVARIDQIMSPTLSEIFFAPRVLLVEGREDRAILESYLAFTNAGDIARAAGLHIASTEGKASMSRPLALLRHLSIPVVAMFDGDREKAEKDKAARSGIQRNTLALASLLGLKKYEPFPEVVTTSPNHIHFPNTFRDSVALEVGNEAWNEASNDTRSKLRLEGVSQKNEVLLAGTIQHLVAGAKGITILDKIVEIACQAT